MNSEALSIRPFVGAKDFSNARAFYTALGFTETILWEGFSLFRMDACAFYLQDAFVEEWINNTQVFVEVADADAFWKKISMLNLPERFSGARVAAVREQPWGSECFVHDPSGVLWHFGAFKPSV